MATGWENVQGVAEASLRHPSGTGPLLEFLTESGAKRGRNRMHLDVRPGPNARRGDLPPAGSGSSAAHRQPGLALVDLVRSLGQRVVCILAPYA